MSSLNKYWLMLMIGGVLLLIGTIGLSVYQSMSGADSEFSDEFYEFSRPSLISKNLEEFLKTSPNFGRIPTSTFDAGSNSLPDPMNSEGRETFTSPDESAVPGGDQQITDVDF